MAPRNGPAQRLDLLVVGHVNIDRFLDVARLPAPDRTVPVLGARDRLGGTAANIALAASHWGVRTGLSSRVGEEFPETFEHELARAGIDTRGLVRVRGERSPTCFVVEDGRGGQLTLIDQGAMGDARRAPVPQALLRRTRWVHLATGDPAYQLRLLAAARKLGRPVAVDPAQEIHYRWGARPLRVLLEGAEILFGNVAELRRAAELLGVSGVDRLTDIVPLVIETRGPRGAVAHSRAGPPIERPAVRPRRVRQVTGAGDAFRGGFYAGWFAGQPLDRCLSAGLRSAGAWVEHGGHFGRAPRGRIP